MMPAAGKIELFVREKGSEEVERHPVADEFRGAPVDQFDPHKREIFVALARGTDFPCHGVPVLEGILFDLLLGNVNVIGRVQVIIVG